MPPRQPDLLDWTPPEPVAAFAPEQVRAATLEARIARAVSVALQDCKLTREEIAARMSAWLGTKVTLNMLNAYASVARQDHPIGLTRFLALVHATCDRRLLELLAEMNGWAVIERRHLPLIEMAAIREQEDELRRRRDALTRKARAEGGL
ncbi:MAG: DNA transposition protein [Roseococcus sp.]|nr:DNA transposition protein [Roseococcus sp.]